MLEALLREGEITPAHAAMKTTLSVAEADVMLKELAEAGHLEVRVYGGGLFYALWEQIRRPVPEIRPAEIQESSKKTSQEALDMV